MLTFSSGSYSLKHASSVAVTTSPFFSVSPSPSSPEPGKNTVEDEECTDESDVERTPSPESAGGAGGPGMRLAPMSSGTTQAIPVRVCMNMRREAAQDLTSKVESNMP